MDHINLSATVENIINQILATLPSVIDGQPPNSVPNNDNKLIGPSNFETHTPAQ